MAGRRGTTKHRRNARRGRRLRGGGRGFPTPAAAALRRRSSRALLCGPLVGGLSSWLLGSLALAALFLGGFAGGLLGRFRRLFRGLLPLRSHSGPPGEVLRDVYGHLRYMSKHFGRVTHRSCV